MIQQALLVAAFVGLAAAVGEYSNPLSTCGCAGIQTYNLATSAYCPSTQFPRCDISKLAETSCMLTCPGPRGQLVFRNNSAIWQAADYITCDDSSADGFPRTDKDLKILAPNLSRPQCAYKDVCNNCSYKIETTTCPAGYTCTPAHVVKTTNEDDECNRLQCAYGQLTLYNNHTVSNYTVKNQLYCTIAGFWANYSADGSTAAGTMLTSEWTVNCIVPQLTQNCTAPTMWTALSQLPASFQTGFKIAAPIFTQLFGIPSLVTCPLGYNLYGFNGNNASATGLEYTSRGYMLCESNRMWSNGGYALLPTQMTAACLQIKYPCAATYSFETSVSLPSGCDSSLVATAALTGNQTCGLGCPAGYRMLVSRGSSFFRIGAGISYDGASWSGAGWFAGVSLSFTMAEAKFTCEPNPFPIDFSWPIFGMIGAGCQNDQLIFSNGAISCAGGLNLVVSTEESLFVNMFMLTSVKFHGKLWTGFDFTTGQFRAFKKTSYFTCYSGVPPTLPPTTTGPTTVPTTTGPTTTGPTTTAPTTTGPTTTAPTTTAPTTTGPTTTTKKPSTCGSVSTCPCSGGATIGCSGGRDTISCAVSASVSMTVSGGAVIKYDRLVFVAGHGWLAFSCDGSMQFWSEVEFQAIVSITCTTSST